MLATSPPLSVKLQENVTCTAPEPSFRFALDLLPDKFDIAGGVEVVAVLGIKNRSLPPSPQPVRRTNKQHKAMSEDFMAGAPLFI
jgi:hypothetical protein